MQLMTLAVTQQAPRGTAQVSVPQSVFGPRHVPLSAVQAAWVRMEHWPLMQQAPVGVT